MNVLIKNSKFTNIGGNAISAPSDINLVIKDTLFENIKKNAVEIRDFNYLVAKTFDEIEKTDIPVSSKNKIKEAFIELIKNPTLQNIKNTAFAIKLLSEFHSTYVKVQELYVYIQSLI